MSTDRYNNNNNNSKSLVSKMLFDRSVFVVKIFLHKYVLLFQKSQLENEKKK